MNHGYDDRPQDIVKAVQIGAEDGIPFLVRHGGKGIVTGDAGVEDHPVAAAMGGHIGFQSGKTAGPIGNIETQQPSVPADCPHGRQRLLRSAAVGAVMDDDVEAVAGQPLGRFPVRCPCWRR